MLNKKIWIINAPNSIEVERICDAVSMMISREKAKMDVKEIFITGKNKYVVVIKANKKDFNNFAYVFNIGGSGDIYLEHKKFSEFDVIEKFS